MRLTLIHNPEAGDAQPSRDELIALTRDAGYRVFYQDAHAKDFAKALERPADVVLVAGGDGTVAKVAKRLTGRDIPLAIIPLGTANNIALTWGVRGSAEEIIHALSTAETTALDVGRANAPWGTTAFVESVGTGFFGSVIRRVVDEEARTGEGKPTTPVEDAARNIERALDAYRPVRRHVLADGEDLSGTYLLVEAMNIRSIGPRMVLAPTADPGDGHLDLVFVRDTDRRAFAEYLARIARGYEGSAPFEARRVRQVTLAWDTADGHLDDETWPENGVGAPPPGSRSVPVVEVEIVDPPVSVLVPAPRA